MSDPQAPDDRPPIPGGEPAPAPAPPRVVADGEVKKLDPRVRTTWRIGYGIAAAIAFALSTIALVTLLFVASIPRPFQLLAFAVWALYVSGHAFLVLFWPGLRYRRESYRVSDDGIEMERGVVFHSTIHVPRSRVQHTDVNRGPIDRAFGLAELVIFTAGTEHASVNLGGLTHEGALAIRDHLIPGGRDDAV